MKLTGKVAVVTGGARDLGRAISVKLALEGAKVCLNYFDNPDDAAQTLGMIKADGGEAIAVQGDMTKADDVKKLFAEAGKAFGGKVDILVNVVGGIVGRKQITEQDEKWYDFLMDVNMRSVFLCTREVVPMMPEGGSIVNFSSQAARDGGGPGASMYAAAKAAVMCHTRAMAKELAGSGHDQHFVPRPLHQARSARESPQHRSAAPRGRGFGGRRSGLLPGQQRVELPHGNQYRHQRRYALLVRRPATFNPRAEAA